MFADLLEGCLASTDAELDEQVRANELAMRRLHAERAALLSVSAARGAYRIDGHRSVNGYLRATCNTSSGEASRQRRIAEACDAVPELGDALAIGRIGMVQVLEIARIYANPRTRQYFARVAPIYLEFAEHDSHRQLQCRIDDFLTIADQDGAFAELLGNIRERNAQVTVIGTALDVRARGGDPLVAEEFVAIHDLFVEAEFAADVEARRVEHGDAADQFPLARTDRQRRFDALIAMARAARNHLATGKPITAADVVVNIVADPRTMNDAFDKAGMVAAENGDIVELDDDTIDSVLATAAADPTAWIERRCHTANGIPLHPMLLLKAAMSGHIRRTIIDSESVVIDRGRSTRLFTGEARRAAQLLFDECSHPGCSVKASLAEVDHMVEWHEGGRTDQDNADIRCTANNRDKHRERWRTRRDEHGRRFTIRPDGTIMLPVGARPPDLSADEYRRIARERVRRLRPPA